MEEFNSLDIEEYDDDFLLTQLNVDIDNQYIVFKVGDEEYGLPIQLVQEIISLPQVTKIPNIEKYIPGVINLRGEVIPLYTLKTRFDNVEVELTRESIVIIIHTDLHENNLVGFVVDSVSDVLSIDENDFKKTSYFEDNNKNRFIEKIGNIGERVVIVLDINNFFTESEKEALEEAR